MVTGAAAGEEEKTPEEEAWAAYLGEDTPQTEDVEDGEEQDGEKDQTHPTPPGNDSSRLFFADFECEILESGVHRPVYLCMVKRQKKTKKRAARNVFKEYEGLNCVEDFLADVIHPKSPFKFHTILFHYG